jgi:hypothetical protein
MPRISMKLTASVFGSLALLLAAACERSTQTSPEPGTTGASQEPNSMRPTPTPSTPGTATTPSGTSAPSGTSTPSGSTTNPSAAAPTDDTDTMPVRGTDPDMQGGGGAGGAGHGGHSGHGGKSSR